MTTLFAAASGRIPRSGKRRVCFPITSRAYYGRSQLLLHKLQSHPDLTITDLANVIAKVTAIFNAAMENPKD